MMVMRHGGVSNRPGSQWVGSVKLPSQKSRLIPFIYDSTTAYVLEFGHLFMRVINSGAYLLESTKAITAATKANPCVITSVAHGYSNGDEVSIAAVLGMTQLNGRNFKVANVAANTFELTDLHGNNINSTAYTTYTSGGTAARVYTLSSIYHDTDLPDVTFTQSADILEMAHLTRGPQRVARVTATTWDTAYLPTFGVAQPSNLVVTGAGAAGLYTDTDYVVIDVDDSTGEEGTGKSSLGYAKPTGGAPHTITWTSNATQQVTTHVYRSYLGVYGLIGISKIGKFVDDGSVTPDFTQRPNFSGVIATNDGFQPPNFAAAVTYFQQRFFQAGGTNHPETVISSRVGLYYNYNIHLATQDSDPLKFVLNAKQVQTIKHLVDVGKLLIFTATGEWSVDGDANGIITPASTFPKQHSYFGCNSLPPIVINASVLFMQSRGSIIRDISYDFRVAGYRGEDLTTYSPHLVDGYTFNAWAHQLTPHSIVWCARSDGKLIGLTYAKDQEIVGWHRHDFNGGSVESVCSIPENNADALYLIVNRTINGNTERYIERFTQRRVDNILDAVFMDATLSYDGRNGAATTMTLSGGTTWGYNETQTLTASATTFVATDVGNAIFLTGSDGTVIRFTITGYTSGTVVTGHPQKTIPASMQAIATAVWTKAVTKVTGLWHLEGKSVSVFADGFVVASPNNAKYDVLTVASGSLTFQKPYGVIHVGLPYISDVETLDIDTAQGETVIDKMKLITGLSARVDASRGLWAGDKPPTDDSVDPLEDLYELKIRGDDEDYDSPVDLESDIVNIDLKGEWSSNGRVFLRQVDPLPLTILAIAPAGLVPFKGG